MLCADEPSARARVDSGTFVRNSGSRSSWRMIPTVTQKAREAAQAKEQAKENQAKRTSVLTSASNIGEYI